MTYDPQDSTPYDDEDLIEMATDRLTLEWNEMDSSRVQGIGVECLFENLVDDLREYYRVGHMSRLLTRLDFAKQDFIEKHLHGEIDQILEEMEQDAREAYGDYLRDR